jgi:choice-of-anchor B domain-containing protein
MQLRYPILLGLAAVLGACSSSPPTGDPGDPTVASITISPATVLIESVGGTATVTATVLDADGEPIAGQTVNWSVKRSGVISVSQTGVITALGSGVDTVVARIGTVTGVRRVQVSQAPNSLLILNGQASFAILGSGVDLVASVRDANNQPVPGALVTWTSSNPDALLVSDNGRLTAVGIGTATITATSGGLSDDFTAAVQINGPIGGPVTGGAVACAAGFAAQFPCDGITLLAYLPPGALGVSNNVGFNDIWGWTDPQTGKEIAIVGRRDGVSFVDVSNPTNPKYLGQMFKTSTSPNSTWRDMKVYQNHVFVVADGAGAHGMQVFDLTNLRGVTVPQTFTPKVTYTNVNSVHNIVINEQTGFAYLVGSSSGGMTCGGGLHMVNIQNPGNPTFAGCFSDPLTGRSGTGYTHDAQCVVYSGPDAAHAGQEICFGANETHVSIANVTVKNAPVAISRASYPAVSYTHQGWLSQDQRFFFVNDELDETGGQVAATRTLVWDVSDLDDPILVKQYLGPTSATDHNNYVVGTRMWASNYQFGVRAINVATPANPTQLGFFDTAPQYSNSPGFNGSWSNYPFFASGIVVVSSIAEGLFVLRLP